jgi:hypothetical protein
MKFATLLLMADTIGEKSEEESLYTIGGHRSSACHGYFITLICHPIDGRTDYVLKTAQRGGGTMHQ